MSLADVTSTVAAKVAANGAPPATIKFDFGGEGCLRIDGNATPAKVDNSTDPATCTIHVSMDDFSQIASGSMNPQMAFMMGKLRIEGDMGLALQLSSILG